MTRELDGYPYHIVYNGEIYNIKELKNDLASHQVFPKRILTQKSYYYPI